MFQLRALARAQGRCGYSHLRKNNLINFLTLPTDGYIIIMNTLGKRNLVQLADDPPMIRKR